MVLLGNLERIPSSQANITNAIYGIDGSPTVKDIYFDDTPNDNTDNPRWRTVLIGGLGAGGNAIYSLDITDINNAKDLKVKRFTGSISLNTGNYSSSLTTIYKGDIIPVDFSGRCFGLEQIKKYIK